MKKALFIFSALALAANAFVADIQFLPTVRKAIGRSSDMNGASSTEARKPRRDKSEHETFQ